jgi:putative tryptophan/tyrosine transport system substrate-binding protein
MRRWAIVVLMSAIAPFVAEAQPAQTAATTHRIGFASLAPPAAANLAVFRQGLRELGYVEGRNLVLEVRSAEGRQERVREVVSELIGLKVDVLVTVSTATALAAQKMTNSVPVVFVSVMDPVAPRIVQTLARPGGNLTGVTGWVGADFAGKWVALLREAAPRISHVAVLWNSANPQGAPQVHEIRAAAGKLKMKADFFDVGDIAGLSKAFAAVAHSGAEGIVVAGDPFFTANRARLIDFAASRRLPAVYFFKRFAEAGGLMAYGARAEESYRRAAAYVDKILRGAKPADLPVERPTQFELVINLKTAKALGLAIPRSLLLQADHVIQ